MILIEDTASGSALISQAKARLTCNVRGVVPRGSKSARFYPHFKTIRARRVHVPVWGDWVADWVEEIRAFPEGEYDDHVDALSMFLDFMATRPNLDPVKRGGGLGAMVNTHGTSEILPRPGPSTRGCIAVATRSHGLSQPFGAPASSGHSFDRGIPERVETRLGPVIIRRG